MGIDFDYELRCRCFHQRSKKRKCPIAWSFVRKGRCTNPLLNYCCQNYFLWS